MEVVWVLEELILARAVETLVATFGEVTVAVHRRISSTSHGSGSQRCLRRAIRCTTMERKRMMIDARQEASVLRKHVLGR